MRRIPVESSNIKSIGYDATRMILEVEFIGGGVYQYVGVPSHEWAKFAAASSKGQYLNIAIKGYYSFRQVSGKPMTKGGKL